MYCKKCNDTGVIYKYNPYTDEYMQYDCECRNPRDYYQEWIDRQGEEYENNKKDQQIED